MSLSLPLRRSKTWQPSQTFQSRLGNQGEKSDKEFLQFHLFLLLVLVGHSFGFLALLLVDEAFCFLTSEETKPPDREHRATSKQERKKMT